MTDDTAALSEYHQSKRPTVRFHMKTQNERIVQYLSAGRSLNEGVARTRFGVKNLRARINDIRASGVCVYTNRSRTDGTSYRIGNPTRAMISTAYAVLGSDAFTGN